MFTAGKPVIVVSGLSRCGTSLVMQMLEAGGIRVTGQYPAFELDRCAGPCDLAWLSDHSGQAIKVLDPHIHNWPTGLDLRVIWLDRKYIEQAKSQVKFGSALTGLGMACNRQHLRAWAKSLARDRAKCLALFEHLALAPLVMQFEQIIEQPLLIAEKLAAFTGARDVVGMAAVVRPRKSSCYPGLLEAELLTA